MVPLVSMDTFNPIATRDSSEDFDPDSNIKSCSFTSNGGFIGSGGWTFPFAVQMQEVQNVAKLRLSDLFFFLSVGGCYKHNSTRNTKTPVPEDQDCGYQHDPLRSHSQDP